MDTFPGFVPFLIDAKAGQAWAALKLPSILTWAKAGAVKTAANTVAAKNMRFKEAS
jgi:hypothetical protein